MAVKPLPRRKREDESPSIAELMGSADVLEEPDLSGVRRASPTERATMERAVEGKPVRGAASLSSDRARTMHAAAGEGKLVPGGTYTLPTSMLKDSPYNARVWYSIEEIDEISTSLQRNGQDVPVAGYVDEDGKVTVVDGSKRLRAARAGGVEQLRVEIRARPESTKEMYLTSRRMNVERSTQTAFDDAVRFKSLLEEKVYAGQVELAADIGLSQSMVSYTLSLNKLPPALVKVMREEKNKSGEAKLCQLGFATEFAKMFDGSGEEAQEKIDLAIEIAREILMKDLSCRQAQDLIRSRTETKRQRSTADKIALRYGSGAGTLKVFPTKGQLDLSLKGIEPGKLEELRLKIESLFSAEG